MMSKKSHPQWRVSRRYGVLLLALNLSACINGPAVDLAPDYQPDHFVIPDSWRGASPFVKAEPADNELRPDWWQLFNDPLLNTLEQQATAANPDLQAAAERFVQARDEMMKVRSNLIPHAGIEFGASKNKQSENSLFHAPGSQIHDAQVSLGGIASWEPDFWSSIRNATRAEIYRAEERAADFGNARLSLQAELAANYFMLRGLDAQSAIYQRSVALYQKSLELVNARFEGAIASALDVARVESLLYTTETKLAQIQGERQVVEHAIAILVNQAPASFKIDPVATLKLPHFSIPRTLPSTLLERRPDIAAMERRMAQANRGIGIARAAFYPNVSFSLGGGYENNSFDLFKAAESFWSFGTAVSLPIFQGGFRRAQLQQSWSAYRETEDQYRSTILNAFREVENGLSLTNRLTAAAERQSAAVEATLKAQNLTMDLYQGGLASSLELIYAQVATLTASVDAVQIKTDLLKNSVALVRALGGGWERGQLPADEQIQPFGVLQYSGLDKPLSAGGIDVNADNNGVNNDLTRPAMP
ncbi:MAG: secretion protein [Gammaproteobacteria bacterium HGW-Gammaproteobacteria-3]|nr:MAG: secretion protein [Gammaproteobacteria bacterium HGW-Gammaproteobacteria-3]